MLVYSVNMFFNVDIVTITSLTAAVAKYCDEHVCVCVCLFVLEDISQTTRAIFTKFFMHVAYGRGSVLLGRVTKSHCRTVQ